MRYQGKIIDWKDEKGFGFVMPNGDDKAFVHISAFSHRSRRPAEGELITYQLTNDAQGRLQAEKIRFVGERDIATIKWSLSFIFMIVFAAIVLLTGLAGMLNLVVLAIYLILSVVTYFIYAIDKQAAKEHRWRIKEDTLHLLGVFGGWPGAVLAQTKLRHKSKKTSFQVKFWMTVIINCAVFGWLFTKNGTVFLTSLLKILALLFIK
ncbi:MAG: DUF1294 domain-containing protein [Sulfuriferula sp.]|nr:DUF1294 domain-containing protein [Sulfuriferula sp.]